MKLLALLSVVTLFGHASAFEGRMAASDYQVNEGGSWQDIIISDDYSGSTYKGALCGGFNVCHGDIDLGFCEVVFIETSGGSYSFTAPVWRTADGCHNIDFQGSLDAHHGYCCGSLPCEFAA